MNNFEHNAGFNPKIEENKTLWNKTLGELDHIVDGLGEHLDPGIKETVASFIVNGFPTNASCEGHVEERHGELMKLNPWVRIGLEKSKYRFIGETEIKNMIASQFNILPEKIEDNEDAANAYWDYISVNKIPETKEYINNEVKNGEFKKEIELILESFYENRPVKEDKRIIIDLVDPAGDFCVTTAKENPETIDPSEVEKYKQELLEEQEEIKAFGAFLKARFLSPDSLHKKISQVNENQEQYSKEEQWAKKVADLKRWHIEIGALDCVISLNVLGIETVSSCEGHSAPNEIDKVDIYPWITIRRGESYKKLDQYLKEFYGEKPRTDFQYHLTDEFGRYLPDLEPLVIGKIFKERGNAKDNSRLYKLLTTEEQEMVYTETSKEFQKLTRFFKNKFFKSDE